VQLLGRHLFRRELLVHLLYFVQQFAAPELVRDAGGGEFRASVLRRPGWLFGGVLYESMSLSFTTSLLKSLKTSCVLVAWLTLSKS